MAQTEKQKPVHKARLGALQLAIWVNEYEADGGEQRTFHTICPFRPHPAGDSDLIRPSIPIASGQGFRSIRPSLWRAAGQCRW